MYVSNEDNLSSKKLLPQTDHESYLTKLKLLQRVSNFLRILFPQLQKRKLDKNKTNYSLRYQTNFFP